MAGPTYTFDVSEGLQPPDVGTITLTQDGADSVTVSVDLLNGYGFLNTGGPHTPFTFNLSGTGALSIDFTTPPNGTYASGVFSLDSAGDANNTPYGTYGVALDSTAGNGTSNAYFGDLVFTLTRAGGLDTSDFIANDYAYFAADLTNGGSVTGAQAWDIRNDPTGVPEPGTMGLFGAGIIAVAAVRRRRQAGA